MIETHESELGQSVYCTELYDYLELTPTYYNRWVRKEIVKNPYLIENKDYCTVVQVSNKPGNKRQEYSIHIDAAKKLCMVSKSKRADEIRNELVKLTREVEEGQRLTSEQFIWVMRMVKVLAIYEYRKLAMTKNAERFVNNFLRCNPKSSKTRASIYSQFHAWRNEVLQTGKDTLETRLKEYCLLERRRLPSKFTQDEALTMLGDYENIKNAVWDLLLSHNKSEEMANNIANLAQEIAKEMKPFLQRLNESNLFFQKIDNKEIKAIGL